MSLVTEAKTDFIVRHAAGLFHLETPVAQLAQKLHIPTPKGLCPVREIAMSEEAYQQAQGARQGYIALAQRAAQLPEKQRLSHFSRLQHALESHGFVFENTPLRTVMKNHVIGAVPASVNLAAELWRISRR